MKRIAFACLSLLVSAQVALAQRGAGGAGGSVSAGMEAGTNWVLTVLIAAAPLAVIGLAFMVGRGTGLAAIGMVVVALLIALNPYDLLSALGY